LPLTQDTIRQLAFEAQFRNMSMVLKAPQGRYSSSTDATNARELTAVRLSLA